MPRETLQTHADYMQALTSLQNWLKPGDTLYTILRSVSRSGAKREIDPIILLHVDDFKGQTCYPLHPRWAISTVLNIKLSTDDYLIVRGGGMDMGFEVAYNLGRALWPEGFTCIGEGCPSSEHFNGDTNYEPHLHADGGYALRHQWL